MYNGILNVYKEKGYTSHDVVALLRGILKQKKIGHTGTLDPLAEGVLPVCLGTGTKLCDMLTDREKEYEAILLLGISTDTQDITGTVLQKKEVNLPEKAVEQAVFSFLGEYNQIPPMYSAIKVEGKKLYELAREGKEIERKARKVEIFSIQILSMDLPKVHIRVSCSKGTYIRTLCHDIGKVLGVGGCMEALVRTRVGNFGIKDALKLAEIEKYQSENKITEKILSVEDTLGIYPKCVVDANTDHLVYNGNPFREEAIPGSLLVIESPVRVYDSKGKFIGVYLYREEKKAYYPLKMFLEP